MEADRALTLVNDMLWNSLVVAGPILLVTLALGVVITITVTVQLRWQLRQLRWQLRQLR